MVLIAVDRRSASERSEFQNLKTLKKTSLSPL